MRGRVLVLGRDFKRNTVEKPGLWLWKKVKHQVNIWIREKQEESGEAVAAPTWRSTLEPAVVGATVLTSVTCLHSCLSGANFELLDTK